MKAGYLFGLAFLLAWGVPGRAEDPSSEPPLAPLHLRLPEDPACPASPMHVYGGGALKITQVVEAPLGTHAHLVADLFQLASGVAAPLQRDVPITPEFSFEDRTYLPAVCVLPSLPAVQRRTTMLLKLKAADSGTSSASRSLTLIVYPAAEPDAWKKTFAARLSRSGLRRLAVFGEGTALRQFLRLRKVAFEDLGQEWPGEFDGQTFYLGETSAPAPPRLADLPGTRLVLFKSQADEPILPAGVYQSSVGEGGSVWKVTLPNLFVLPGSHPDAEATLDEIFRAALEPRPPVHTESQTVPATVFSP